MYNNTKRLFTPLIIPSLLILLSIIIGWQWNRLLQQADIDYELTALLTIFPHIPYLLFAIVTILGIRSKNSGLILISIILSISYFILIHSLDNTTSKSTLIIPRIISFLLPINIFLFSYVMKKKLKQIIVYLFLILIEVGIFLFLYYMIEIPNSQFIIQFHTEFPKIAASLMVFTQHLFSIFFKTSFIENIPGISLISIIIIVFFMLLKFVKSRDVRISGNLFALISVFLALCSQVPAPALMIFFTTSGLILLITTIEASFSMASIDELTGLHGRRSLNETLSTLSKNYAIAMLDIDFFKKFNDKFGHKTGDEVLKMVATKLNQIGGGAKAFRFGGEEFTVIFAGKTAKESKPFMEEFRKNLESTKFIVRSPVRKTASQKSRGKHSFKERKKVAITISIGIADYGENLTKSEKVLKAADKILYKAKRLGRNRVEI